MANKMAVFPVKLYEFADVYAFGHWTEGFILKLTPEAIWTQVDVSISPDALPIPPDQTAPFRSKRRGDNQNIDLQISIKNVGQRLGLKALNKPYLKSESAFVQFFAGLLPRYWTTAVIEGLTEEVVQSIFIVLTDFLVESGRPRDVFQSIVSASEASWECVIPVLSSVLLDPSLGQWYQKMTLFKAYLSALVASNYSSVWIKSFESVKGILMAANEENRVNLRGRKKKELYEVFRRYLQYCIRLLRKEESFAVLLLFLRVQNSWFQSRSERKKADETVQISIEDLAFIADSQEFEPLKRDIIWELCKSRSKCTANKLLTNHFLNDQIVLSLLSSPCGKPAAVHLSRMGLTVSFLKTCFFDDWNRIVQEALWKEPGFVFMLDRDIIIIDPDVDGLFLQMTINEQAHYCEVGRADISDDFQKCRMTKNEGILRYFRERRKAIMLIVMKTKVRQVGKDVWRIVLQEFLYPR